ncbi:MAG: lysylphosphatidylglycerol synthase domain-containing protein [Thermoleophilia bacterium]
MWALVILFFVWLAYRHRGSLFSYIFAFLALVYFFAYAATHGKKGLRIGAQIFLIGIVFFFLGRKIYADWGNITSHDWQFDFYWLALSIIFFCMMYLGHAGGWLLILWRFKHSIPILPGIYIWFKSLLGRYVPGNVLMIVGRVMMTETYDVPKRVTLTSVAYEQALLAASATTVLAIALPFLPKLQDFSQLIWIALIVPPLAIIGLHPAVLGRIGNYVFRKLGRETIEVFLPFWEIIWVFLYYCFFWVVAGLALFSMIRTVTWADWSDLPIVIASTALAWMTSVLFFISPSGLGIREGVYAFTLDFVFENAGVASAFAILVRFWQTLIEIGLVFVLLAIVKIKHYKFKTPSG